MKNKKNNQSNNNRSIVYRMWKRHKRSMALISSLGCLATAGAGVGVGYLVWHNKNSNPNPVIVDNYWLVKDNDIIKGVGNTVILTAYYNGSTYTGNYVADSSNVSIINSIVVLNAPPTETTKVIITEVTHNVTTTITLLPDNPVPVPLGGNFATWEELDNETNNIFTYDNVTKTISGVNTDNLSKKMTALGKNGIDFRDNVLFINNNAFQNCPSMNETGTVQYLKFTNVASVGNNAFYGCTGLKQIYLGDGNTTTHNLSIGESAFANCVNLAYFGVAVAARFTSVGTSAFRGCASFTSRDFFQVSDDNLGTLGAWDTMTNANKGGWIKNLQTNSECLGCIAFGEINITTLDSIGSYAFEGCASLKTVDSWADKDVNKKTIGNQAFSNCTNLVNITIPSFVTSIGKKTFQNCKNLTGVDLSATVVASIGDWAFADCTNLLVITLPTSVTSIGTSAFQSCERLVNFEFVNSAPTHNNDLSIGYGVFNDCKSLKFIQLATKINTTGINNTTFYLCSNAGVIKSNQVSGGNDAETNWIPNLPGTGNTRWYFIQNPAS